MNKIKIFTILLLLAAFNVNLTAQNAGDLDTTFNNTDKGFDFGSEANNVIRTTAIQTDGKIIIGGFFTYYNAVPKNYIARLNPDSNLDSSFVIGTGANGAVLTTAIQSDGKIIIGGEFTSYNGTPRNRIARLNTDGSLDTSFVVGSGTDTTVQTIAIQSDGKIIIGGNFFSYNGTSRNRIARLNSDGSLDTSFLVGTGASGIVYTTAIQSDGKILLGGGFGQYNGYTRYHVARLNTDGSLDLTFIVGAGANNIVRTTAIQSDGKVIIGGTFTSYNGTSRNRIARLNADGSLDTSFIVGTGANSTVYTTAIQTNGQLIIGGGFWFYNGTPRGNLARLNPDGSLDTTYAAGSGSANGILTTAIQTDGKIIIGGWFSSYNQIVKRCIARLNTDGSLDTSFTLVGTGANNAIYTTAIQTDGKIIIGGNFTSYNGTPINRIARLHPDGSLDTSFIVGTGANSSVETIAIQADGKIIIGGYFTSFNGISRNHIVRLHPNGSIDYSFVLTPGADNGVLTIAIHSNGQIIIGGNFTSYNGTPINRIARLHSNGQLDPSFVVGMGANNDVRTTAIQSDGKIIIGGNFSSYNNTPRSRIARLNNNGSIDITFSVGTGANGSVFTTAIQNDGKIIIGGTFTSYNGTLRNKIARLNINGSLDTSFAVGTGLVGYIWKAAIQNDGKIIIGGNFSSYNGIPRSNIARLNINSSLDTSFVVGTGTSNIVYTTAIQSDGKIIIGGSFTSYNGIGRNRIARLLQCTTNPSTDVHTVCDSFTWIDGNTYTINTNTPIYHVFNAAGCVSVVTLNLTVNSSTYNTDMVTTCDSITWIDGNTYTSSINTPTFTFTNSVGCDSVVTLNLTVNNINTNITQNSNTLIVGEVGAIYQWLDCNNSNAPISGVTSQNFTPTANGDYAVEVTKNGCTDTSACINFILTGINELENSFVKIYPNPTSSAFIIELVNSFQDTQLNIVSIEGKTVYSSPTINSNKLLIDASEWREGIYVVKITDKQSSKVVKLIKQ